MCSVNVHDNLHNRKTTQLTENEVFSVLTLVYSVSRELLLFFDVSGQFPGFLWGGFFLQKYGLLRVIF